MNRLTKLLVMGMLAIVLLSCSFFNFSRNDDGSFRVESTLSLQIVQSIIENAVQFTDIVNMNLELKDGYIFVQADQVEYQGRSAKDVSFHLELGAANGQVTARITNINVSNNVFDDATLEPYNQILEEQLSQATQQSGASLESISVSPDGVKMVWLFDPNDQN